MFQQKAFLGYLFMFLFGIAGIAPFFLLKKKLLLKTLTCACAVGAFFIGSRMKDGYNLFFIISFLIMLVALFFFALKPSVDVAIMSKAGTGSPIEINSTQHFKVAFAKDVLPAEDMQLANRELGAIISDIQKLGDYGIDKWKVE